MSNEISPKFPELQQRSLIERGAAEAGVAAGLEVNVVFTDHQGTLAALRAAGVLAANLGAHINLLVFQVVPIAFPLAQPPVAIAVTEQRLAELARQGVQGPLDTSVHLYLCRDRQQALLQALKPKSLIVIGTERRWWQRGNAKVARTLRSNGHQVVFAPSN